MDAGEPGLCWDWSRCPSRSEGLKVNPTYFGTSRAGVQKEELSVDTELYRGGVAGESSQQLLQPVLLVRV